MSISLGADGRTAQASFSEKGKDVLSMGQSLERKTRRTGIGARTFLVVLLAALIPGAALAGAQARSYSAKSFALRHSVVVIGPNSPLFETILEKDFPEVSGVDYFQAIKPLLAIVHNNTRRVVKAYVVKWTITNADGSTSTQYLPVMRGPTPGGADLTGRATIMGPAGTGLGTQLVSPFFHWPRRAFPSLLKINAVMISFQAANTKPLVSGIQGATAIQTTLDGAIFGDGVFIGPDTSKLFERLQAAQKAAVDEVNWVLGQLNDGAAEQQIQDALSQQIYDGRNAAAGDFYTAAKGEQANRMVSALQTDGRARLQAFAAQLAKTQRMKLQRLAAH